MLEVIFIGVFGLFTLCMIGCGLYYTGYDNGKEAAIRRAAGYTDGSSTR